MAKALQCEQEKSSRETPLGVERVSGLSRSLDAWLGPSLVDRIGTTGREKPHNLSRRIRKEFPGLPKDVCDKIAASGLDSLKRVSNCVEAVKDNLCTSSPDLVRGFADSPEYKKLIHWATCLAAHRSDRVTKEWKKFSALLKWMALKSETAAPEIPQDFPGFHGTWKVPELPPFWCKLVPWLGPVTVRGVNTKDEATRLCHITSSRGFPAGDRVTRQESLVKHSANLHRTFPITEVRGKILERLAYFVGKLCLERTRDNDLKSGGHLSLTSNASLDSSVKDGGRAQEVSVMYRSWAAVCPNQEVLGTTWFGQPYWEIPEVPRWQTMCRSERTHKVTDEAGESDDRLNLDFDNFKLSDPLFGLDHKTGFQLLQWSIEEGISQGILGGSKSWSDQDPLRLTGSVFPSIRPSAIGEPGAKSRVVTVAEGWLTIFLQPWCHHIVEMLRQHPSNTSGLTRGWQLYEWVKRLTKVSQPPEVYFLSSDLTTATDFCVHEYSLAMLKGFHRGIERESDRYFGVCAELLCSARTYEGLAIEEFFDEPTTAAILMGDPGAKPVLTLHNNCAEYEAFLRWHWNMLDADDETFFERLRQSNGPPACSWRCFACSGDDHFGQGPKSYLSCITRCHEKNGMSVSWPQNFISRRGGFYCEEMLVTVGLRPDQIWRRDVPLRDVPYEEQPHIDAMKVRLLSPCAKEHEGKDEPNPAIGKARQMHGMLAWLGGNWTALRPIFSARWERRMKAFLPPVQVRYLPVQLGGIEAPAYHLSMTEVRVILRALPEYHQWAIKQVLDGTATPLLRRALASFSTNARARGISSDLIEDQIKETLQIADLVGGLDDAKLRIELGIEDETEWANLRLKDKSHLAKRKRLVTVADAINLIGRPYLFRDMLYPEISTRHGIDPYRTAQYDAVPWPKRLEALERNVRGAIVFPQSGFTPLSEDTIERIARWCVENVDLEVPREVYFFPEAVVVHQELATLRTPL